MKNKGLLFLGMAFLLLAVGGVFGVIFLGKRVSPPLAVPTPQPTPLLSPVLTSTPVPLATATPAGVVIPTGWLTYTSSEYGFQISYPPDYEALDDATNLYGWPNGVVLFYGGGQSYDLAVEAWDNQSEYQAKYQNQMNNLTAQQVGSKYITLLNQNFLPIVDQMITTFQAII